MVQIFYTFLREKVIDAQYNPRGDDAPKIDQK